METKYREKNEEYFFCKKCNYRCKYNSDFVKHTMTAKHQMETFGNKHSRKLGNAYECNVGKYMQRVPVYGNINKNVFKIILWLLMIT